MEEFYLSEILSKEMSAQEAIVSILKARGFLIDRVNGHYYFSDNATVKDAEYLSKSFSRYGLGVIIDNKEYMVSSRRIWYEILSTGSYEYKAIRPNSIEIVISDNASIDSAIEFFNSTGRFYEECTTWRLTWHQYTIEILGPKANVSHLEPYVAYYVKAVSSCGVFTSISCDGNHPDGGEIYVKSDFPSNIWHWYLWKYIVQTKFGPLPYIGKGIQFNPKNQQEVYSQVYKVADFLYTNRKTIRALKQKTLEHIDKRFLRTHSDDEVELFYRAECERILQSNIDSIVKYKSED